MTLRLTPAQEAIVQRAFARGVADTPEDVVTAALRVMDADHEPSIEQKLGMSREQLDIELRKGLDSLSETWGGAENFKKRMRDKHQAATGDRSPE